MKSIEDEIKFINNKRTNEKGKKLKHLNKLEYLARLKLIKKYDESNYFYGAKKINDIINNEKSRYVEAFKEFVIYEDHKEYLKQFYNDHFQIIMLQKILDYYEKYSKIFPNYTSLSESKYFYKNIKRKQKVIDQINENKKNKNDEDNNNSFSYYKTIFDSKVMNSIYNEQNDSEINKNIENKENTVTNNDSILNFISQISQAEIKSGKMVEQRKIYEKKNSNDNLIKNQGKIFINKISKILSKNNNNLRENYIKKRTKIQFRRNIEEKNKLFNDKIILNSFNYISKQKSFSKLNNANQKINYNIQKTISKKTIVDSFNKLSKKKNIDDIINMKGNIYNNISKNNKPDLKDLLNYEKFKKVVLSTNNIFTPRLTNKKLYLSPKNSINFIKKEYASNSKNISEDKNKIITTIIKKNDINNNINLSKNKKTVDNKEEKQLFKRQINKQNNKQLLNKYYSDNNTKYNSSNISLLSTKPKNKRNCNNNFTKIKSRIVNNINIMNNSPQINIYTGNDVFNSLNLYLNSIIYSTKSYRPFHDNILKNKKKSISKIFSEDKDKKIKNIKYLFEKSIKEPNTERLYKKENLFEKFIKEKSKGKNQKKI